MKCQLSRRLFQPANASRQWSYLRQRLSTESLYLSNGRQAPLACALQSVDLPTKRVAARLGSLPTLTDDASSPLTITYCYNNASITHKRPSGAAEMVWRGTCKVR